MLMLKRFVGLNRQFVPFKDEKDWELHYNHSKYTEDGLGVEC